MSNPPPQREINARTGRTGSRLATPATVATPAGPAAGEGLTLRGFFSVFRYSSRAIELVWSTSAVLTVALGLLTIVAGVLPAGIAYVGSLIVDAVVAASRAGGTNPAPVIELVILEGVLIAAVAAAQRGISLCQSLLRAQQ
jgi:ATP-binding cassette, subfamily B, bacterial